VFIDIVTTVSDRLFLEMPAVYVAIVSIVSLFLFWRSVQRTCQDRNGNRGACEDMTPEELTRWGHKVFDLVIISIISTLIFSRLMYMVQNWGEFADARWFWLPYEKIDGEVFLFASFPWLLLKIWDGGLLLIGLVIGWMISMILFSRMMGIRWGSISNALADFFWFWFVAMGLYGAVRLEMWWLLVVIGYLCVLGFVRWGVNRRKHQTGMDRVHRVVSFVWKVSVIIGVPSILFIYYLFYQVGEISIFLVALSCVGIGVGVWILVGDFLEFISVLKSEIPGFLGMRGSEEEEAGIQKRMEEPIARTDVAGSVPEGEGWRRFVVENPKKSRGERGSTSGKWEGSERDFSRSYKNFSRRWRDGILVLWARLTRGRKRDIEEDG